MTTFIFKKFISRESNSNGLFSGGAILTSKKVNLQNKRFIFYIKCSMVTTENSTIKSYTFTLNTAIF